ncbi:hypothetical protein [Caldalkalibacillus mannanilyticus]|uniref:hypothetical protein n=1 Tax=Caldalkalibacillus mannanilyticus TaxID=1418 RepID=UPI00046AE04D|nr:hypothetical protein [Caldalkalibacillus mannanilyticus]
MNQDRMEKKILESIQTLEIPGPDPEFEAKVRSQFLNKASHSKRKRNSYKVIKYTSVAAATIFLGSYLYNSNVLELIPSNQKEIVQEYSEKDTKIQTAELSKGMWEKFTLSLADGYQVISAPDQSFSLFVDADHKKLYMVKGDQGLLIHESANDIVNMQLVPFPNQEDRFYVFINELDATSESESRNMTAVLYELHADGSAEFIHDLPQAGYYGDYQVYWSPKGERAFITFENQEGYW